MAAASPRCWGRGADLISPLLSCEGSPQPSWAGGLGALPEAQNGGGAARRRRPGRASQGRVGRVGKKQATLFGVFYPIFRLGKGRPVGP